MDTDHETRVQESYHAFNERVDEGFQESFRALSERVDAFSEVIDGRFQELSDKLDRTFEQLDASYERINLRVERMRNFKMNEHCYRYHDRIVEIGIIDNGNSLVHPFFPPTVKDFWALIEPQNRESLITNITLFIIIIIIVIICSFGFTDCSTVEFMLMELVRFYQIGGWEDWYLEFEDGRRQGPYSTLEEAVEAHPEIALNVLASEWGLVFDKLVKERRRELAREDQRAMRAFRTARENAAD